MGAYKSLARGHIRGQDLPITHLLTTTTSRSTPRASLQTAPLLLRVSLWSSGHPIPHFILFPPDRCIIVRTQCNPDGETLKTGREFLVLGFSESARLLPRYRVRHHGYPAALNASRYTFSQALELERASTSTPRGRTQPQAHKYGTPLDATERRARSHAALILLRIPAILCGVRSARAVHRTLVEDTARTSPQRGGALLWGWRGDRRCAGGRARCCGTAAVFARSATGRYPKTPSEHDGGGGGAGAWRIQQSTILVVRSGRYRAGAAWEPWDGTNGESGGVVSGAWVLRTGDSRGPTPEPEGVASSLANA
ncbi:hypothetical protein DFH08DRAFT_813101 [Mycena albidolilacea]|uniref:Uncharacterized protein n=1 Tax=Mycena albidolilacea TaxID=1033008 RepID=A0AAD6ZS59_9AGAR|nr:hypothetical protein DFH08DRAFT_813101 [Mycena albidolilacea]